MSDVSCTCKLKGTGIFIYLFLKIFDVVAGLSRFNWSVLLNNRTSKNLFEVEFFKEIPGILSSSRRKFGQTSYKITAFFIKI